MRSGRSCYAKAATVSHLISLLLPLVGVLWATGWLRRQARRSASSMGNTALGFLGVWAALTWLWKNRKDAITVVAFTSLGLASLAFVAVWKLVPEWRYTITVPVVVAALLAYLWWDYGKTGGRPLAAVIGEQKERNRAYNAVASTHDNARVRRVERTASGWEMVVDHTGKIEPELVGQALQTGDAKLVATDVLGRSKLVLDNERHGPWDRLFVDQAWPGPSTLKAGNLITVGFDSEGAPVTIPWPGSGGRHLLVGGSTGGGKSVLLRVIVSELAYCPNVELVLCDPKMIEFRGWAERAHVARGAEATGAAFDAVYAEMMRRYETIPDDDVEWDDSMGPWIVLVVDELATLRRVGSSKEKAEREAKLELLISMGRAAGIGLVLATQRPSHEAMSTDVRDNCRVRIGMGCESLQQASMVMGDSVDVAPCHTIPESLNGGMFVRVDRRATRARSLFLGPSEPRRIAAETAQHKGEAEWLKVR